MLTNKVYNRNNNNNNNIFNLCSTFLGTRRRLTLNKDKQTKNKTQKEQTKQNKENILVKKDN